MENNLEIDVKNAKELGLSYGYYKALTYNPDSTPIKKTKEIICPVCGGLVKPPRIKFCSKECLIKQSKENKRLASHERYHGKVKFLKKEGE